MTYRVIWTGLHEWWPTHIDVATEDEANLFALRKAREVGGHVTVHEIEGES